MPPQLYDDLYQNLLLDKIVILHLYSIKYLLKYILVISEEYSNKIYLVRKKEILWSKLLII